MLPEVKTILYASDIGEGSRPAFRRALALCGDEHTEITYLNVIEPMGANAKAIVSSVIPDEQLKAFHDEGITRLKETIHERITRFFDDEMGDEANLDPSKVSVQVEEGIVWQTILDVADEVDADVIVMGCRTHSAIGQALLGSTANKVMYHSHRPVLIVPLGKS